MIPVEQMTAVPSPVASRGGRRLLLAVAFPVALMAGFWFRGLVAPVASAAPESTRPPLPTATSTPQAVPTHTATADTDIGPGQAEPMLVSSP
jgi:hypothetical protein